MAEGVNTHLISEGTKAASFAASALHLFLGFAHKKKALVQSHGLKHPDYWRQVALLQSGFIDEAARFVAELLREIGGTK